MLLVFVDQEKSHAMTDECGVIQVTNVAPTATTEQMQTLFGFIGKVLEVVLYPEEESTFASKMCYVKFADADDVCVALHLSNTIFIDRAIVVSAVLDGRIPDEQTALESHPDVSRAGGSNSSALASTESSKADEIKRTIYVSNLDNSITPEFLMQMFGSKAGEVKYVRMAGDEGLTTRAAFIEFTHQASVMLALSLTGLTVVSHPIRVVPAMTSIVKPVAGLMGATSKELEEALKKVSEAEPLIAAVVDPDSRHSRSRSRRRSKSQKRRSRSRSRSRRSRSRSHRSRRRSKSKSPRKKSRSPRRRRSKSRSPRRRSGSRLRHTRKRSRSRSPKLGSRSQRSRSRDRSKKEDVKSRESGSRSSPRPDRSSARDRSDRDDKANKDSSRSRADTTRRSPGRRSGVKRSRSKSKSPRRDKEKDRNCNSSRDRSNRATGRNRDRERDRDRERMKDKDHDRGRDREQTKSRDNKKERREDRDRDLEENREKNQDRTLEENREKNQDRTQSTSKRSRYDKDEPDDRQNSPVRNDVDLEKTVSDSEMNLSDS